MGCFVTEHNPTAAGVSVVWSSAIVREIGTDCKYTLRRSPLVMFLNQTVLLGKYKRYRKTWMAWLTFESYRPLAIECAH